MYSDSNKGSYIDRLLVSRPLDFLGGLRQTLAGQKTPPCIWPSRSLFACHFSVVGPSVLLPWTDCCARYRDAKVFLLSFSTPFVSRGNWRSLVGGTKAPLALSWHCMTEGAFHKRCRRRQQAAATKGPGKFGWSLPTTAKEGHQPGNEVWLWLASCALLDWRQCTRLSNVLPMYELRRRLLLLLLLLLHWLLLAKQQGRPSLLLLNRSRSVEMRLKGFSVLEVYSLGWVGACLG